LPNAITGKISPTLMKEIIPKKNTKRKEAFTNSFYEASIDLRLKPCQTVQDYSQIFSINIDTEILSKILFN
jgi:hypothetical protein